MISLTPAVWRLIAIGGAIAALLGAVWAFGAYERGVGADGERRAEAVRLEAARKAVAKHEAAAQAITDNSATQLAKTRVEIQTRTITLIQKVPTYVTAKADADCTVPVGFVRLHDAAASGGAPSLPGSSGGSEDTASGVPLSAVASTVVANYGVAYDWRAEALTWRTWYAAQAAAWK